MRFSGFDWLDIGFDAWMLGAESAVVMALRGAKLAHADAAAWTEAQRMVAEKTAANFSFGLALASGRLGDSAEQVTRGALRHYGKRVRANRRRLSR